MDVIEAIHTRRSMRSYLHQRVERELIEQVIWDTAQAPRRIGWALVARTGLGPGAST
jgi:nitroreductase